MTILKLKKEDFDYSDFYNDGDNYKGNAYRLIAINNKSLNLNDRKIYVILGSNFKISEIYYWDKKYKRYYSYAKMGMVWRIRAFNTTYVIDSKVKLEFDEVIEYTCEALLPFEVGKYYEMRNGFKVKIVADCGLEYDDTQYVGIYQDETADGKKQAFTVRYDFSGKVVSRNENYSFEIVSKWKDEEKVWIVLYYSRQMDGQIASILCHSEYVAKEYETKFKAKNIFIKTEEIKIAGDKTDV